jgi:hypothetical protein
MKFMSTSQLKPCTEPAIPHVQSQSPSWNDTIYICNRHHSGVEPVTPFMDCYDDIQLDIQTGKFTLGESSMSGPNVVYGAVEQRHCCSRRLPMRDRLYRLRRAGRALGRFSKRALRMSLYSLDPSQEYYLLPPKTLLLRGPSCPPRLPFWTATTAKWNKRPQIKLSFPPPD